MSDTQDYIRVTVPAPGERHLYSFIHSEISHSFEAKTPISSLGVWPSNNLLPDTITVGLSHALA